jgi:hypothetical protein
MCVCLYKTLVIYIENSIYPIKEKKYKRNNNRLNKIIPRDAPNGRGMFKLENVEKE